MSNQATVSTKSQVKTNDKSAVLNESPIWRGDNGTTSIYAVLRTSKLFRSIQVITKPTTTYLSLAVRISSEFLIIINCRPFVCVPTYC